MVENIRKGNNSHMPRPPISQQQKEQEGAFLRERFYARQEIEKDLTVDSLADEFGCTQGLISNWMAGRTPIPDKSLLILGARLDFDAVRLRPSVADYMLPSLTNRERKEAIATIAAALDRCSDADFARSLGVLSALFSTAEIKHQ